MPKPLIVDAPYPDPQELSHDAYTIKIISPAYATSSGELNAILQYIYHSFNFSSKGKEEIATTIESIAIAEMLHLELLGKSILALGAQPIYSAQPPATFNFYSAKYANYGCTLRSMIEDDIMAEKQAICTYERMLTRLKNQLAYDIIARILEDEKLHLTAFRGILADICGDK
jgi:bacterioferritin